MLLIERKKVIKIMTIIIVLLVNIIICLFALYWLISEEIRESNSEIKDKLKRLEKESNLLRKEVNELLDTWKNVKKD